MDAKRIAEIRTYYTGPWQPMQHAHVFEMLDALEAQRREIERLREIMAAVNETTFSHVDGRDLLKELHPRHTLDIKRRVDARETWFQGDWLTNLYSAMEHLRAALAPAAGPEDRATGWFCAKCGNELDNSWALQDHDCERARQEGERDE